MNEYNQEKNGELELDIKRLWTTLLRKCWIIILTAVLCAGAAFGYTQWYVTPLYESSVMFYVNNSTSANNASSSISNSDVLASKSLVETYIVIVNSNSTLDEVVTYADLDKSSNTVKDMISASAVEDTEILKVVVTSPDPYEAERIANAIAYVFPQQVAEIVRGSSAKVVESAALATSPSSPSLTKNCVVGFALGMVAAVGILVLLELFNISIRSEEDISRCGSYPVLTAVPDMAAAEKGGSHYAYGGKKHAVPSGKPALIGSGINFTASEAYKLLRTKLQYSFADDNRNRVIGVSSALVAEGKSLTSTNLAYSLSQLDKKVLLVDCDMRRPSLTAKLPVQKKPGLSGYLSGQHELEHIIQHCGLSGEETAFDVIASGHTPPNPIELLSSTRMAKLLALLRERYDYIIMDLPPIGEVSDALAVSKELDGILLVVRQHYCNRPALRDTIRQFEFVGCKILGIVYNFTHENGAGYGKPYYKRYYKHYGGKYAGSYLRDNKTPGQVK